MGKPEGKKEVESGSKILAWYGPLAWLALFAFVFSLHLTNVSSELGGNLGGDNAVYYFLSKSIAEGMGYKTIYEPGAPPHVKYPFLFPAVLAPCHWLSDDPFPLMHGLVALFSALASLAIGLVAAGRQRSRAVGLVFGLATGTMPLLYLQSGHLLSETLYMALGFFAVLAAAEGEGDSLSGPRLLALAVLVSAALMTRTAGLALCVSVVIGLFQARTRLQVGAKTFPAWALVLMVFVLVMGAWLTRNQVVGGRPLVYGSELFYEDDRSSAASAGAGDFLRRIENNALTVPSQAGLYAFAPAWFLLGPGRAGQAAGLVLFAAAILGVVIEYGRGRRVMEGFYLVSIIIVMLWPFSDIRFTLPLLPMSLYYLFAAAKWTLEKFSSQEEGGPAPLSRFVLPGLLILVLVFHAYGLYGFVKDRLTYMPDPPGGGQVVYVNGYGDWDRPVIDWGKYDLRFSGIDRKTVTALRDYVIINKVAGKLTPEGSIIMSRKPMLTAFYADRPSVMLVDGGPDEQWKRIEDGGAGYIITGISEPGLEKTMSLWPERFKTLADIPPGGARLIRVIR